MTVTAVTQAATAAWERYRSTCIAGGTPEQRRWAFDGAMKAERKLWAVDRAAEKRVAQEQKRAQVKAAHA